MSRSREKIQMIILKKKVVKAKYAALQKERKSKEVVRMGNIEGEEEINTDRL